MHEFDTNRSAKSDNNVKQLLFRFFSYWPLFLIVISLCVAAAWIYLRTTLPVYQSSATIMINDERKGTESSKMQTALDMFSSNKIVENEIEVLRSRRVMVEVIKKLCLYAPVYKKGEFKNIPAYDESPVRIEVRSPDSLLETEKIFFTFNASKHAVVIGNNVYPLNLWVNLENNILRFVTNVRYRPKENARSDYYFSLVSIRAVASDLQKNVEVTPASKLSTIVNLKLKDPVPARGEDILNGVIQAYNSAAIREKSALSANALAFVEERLRYVVGELDSVEAALQQYKASKGVVDISEQGKLFLESVETNDKKISEINVQLAVLDQVEDIVKNDKSAGIAPSTLGLSDGILAQLLNKLYDAELEYEKLKRTTAENNPILISVQNQIEKIKPSILENIKNQRINLEASKGNLSGTSGRYNSLLRNIPQKERQLLDITRQQSIKNNIYTFLLQKREDAALSFASAVSDSRLVDNAESGINPVSPKKPLIYAMALFVGLGLPIAFISLKELFTPVIRTKSEIEDLSDFPILGEINFDKSRDAFVIGDDKKSYVAEQIRQIRTSLSYLGITPGKNKILVTSTSQGEGKTFVATNLAISLALTNKKVVLVELDLRRPGLAELFKLKSNFGVADYLQKKSERESIIYQTTFNQNLYLIPAGERPSNPSELISNGRVEELFNHLHNNFDYVIIETAPVGPVTDAYILSKLCNATLFVIRCNKTLKEDIRILNQVQKIRGLNKVAFIFNAVRTLGFQKRSYEYGYTRTRNIA